VFLHHIDPWEEEAMSDTVTAMHFGSAAVQGDLWSARARDYADL
jgi:hypothetical protein